MGIRKNLTNTVYSVYFSVVRKEETIAELSDPDKHEQDMSFLRCVLEKARGVTGYSLYSRWFPKETSVIFERLFSRKPADKDVGGLLGLIMFAGLEDNSSDNQTIEEAYAPKDTKEVSNLLFESQQNTSALMFGITMDDVSKPPSMFQTLTNTNHYLYPQGTRFLETVRECCINPKSFVNIIFRRNSQRPNPDILRMLRCVAREVLFRLSMMFLKQNHIRFSEKMEENINRIDPTLVACHKEKIDNLLKSFLPATQHYSKDGFKTMEKCVGHDLLVQAIMVSAKNSRYKNLFAKTIPPLQWEKFENDKSAISRRVPERDALFIPAEKPMRKLKAYLTEGKLFWNLMTMENSNSNSPCLFLSAISEPCFTTTEGTFRSGCPAKEGDHAGSCGKLRVR